MTTPETRNQCRTAPAAARQQAPVETHAAERATTSGHRPGYEGSEGSAQQRGRDTSTAPIRPRTPEPFGSPLQLVPRRPGAAATVETPRDAASAGTGPQALEVGRLDDAGAQAVGTDDAAAGRTQWSPRPGPDRRTSLIPAVVHQLEMLSSGVRAGASGRAGQGWAGLGLQRVAARIQPPRPGSAGPGRSAGYRIWIRRAGSGRVGKGRTWLGLGREAARGQAGSRCRPLNDRRDNR